MRIAHTVAALQEARRALVLERFGSVGRRPLIGLVPTMGALHAGHRTLVERMCAECDVALVSIFVNPRQFGPREDYGRYPRTLEADAALCEAAGADIIFAPAAEDMYPLGYATQVSVAGLTARWCGASRPGHFDGVTTVVAKLFTICGPDQAYFGEKDFQQLAVVKAMARDLNLGVEVVAVPTVREADGLALSSRNAYLSADERAVAPRLYAALCAMAARFSAGEQDAARLCALGAELVQSGPGPGFELEYLALVDPASLEPRGVAQPGDRILIAARLGQTRLIDNLALPPG